jgi:hypothetical protein
MFPIVIVSRTRSTESPMAQVTSLGAPWANKCLAVSLISISADKWLTIGSSWRWIQVGTSGRKAQENRVEWVRVGFSCPVQLGSEFNDFRPSFGRGCMGCGLIGL